jgi:hypothetical protein
MTDTGKRSIQLNNCKQADPWTDYWEYFEDHTTSYTCKADCNGSESSRYIVDYNLAFTLGYTGPIPLYVHLDNREPEDNFDDDVTCGFSLYRARRTNVMLKKREEYDRKRREIKQKLNRKIGPWRMENASTFF